jgi:tetratricopeptide (TPR) repeat protein
MLGLGRAPDHPIPTAAAILDMFKLATESEPAATALATVMACAAPEPLPESTFDEQVVVVSENEEPSAAEIALISLTDVLTRDRAMAALHQFSLVIREDDVLRVHPLVQSIVKEATPVEERPAWARAALVLLLNAADPYDESSKTSGPAALGAHIAAAVEFAILNNSDPHMIYSALGWLGLWQLRYGELNAAVTYLARGLQVGQAIPLPPQDVMVALSQLARAQRMAGMITETLGSLDVWLQLAHTHGDMRQIGDALLARAQTFAYAARYPEARGAFGKMTRLDDDRRLGTRERILRLSLLADIEQGLGHLDAAFDAITAALALVPHVRDEVHRRDHLAALDKQAGIVLREMGRPQEALPHLWAAYHATEGMPAVYTAESILALVSVLLDLDQPDEARPLVDKGLVISAVRGAESPLRGSFLQVRGRIALEAGELPQARADLEAAVKLLFAGGEPYRVNLASGYFNLGAVSTVQQRHADAVDYFRLARDLDAKIFGSDHSELIGDELNVAEAYFRVGDHSEAAHAIRRCLTLIRAGHPQGRSLRNRVLETAIAIDAELGLDGSESQPRSR